MGVYCWVVCGMPGLSKTWIGQKMSRDAHHDSLAEKYGYTEGEEDKNCKVACCCWFLGLIGCCGCHRCYLGNYCTGTAWFCTLGCVGICQVYDVFCMKYLTDRANSRGTGDWGG